MNADTAELIGFFIGDGCLCRYFSKYDSRWKSVVLFTGNLKNDRTYYEEVLRPIIMKNFNVNGYVYLRRKDNTIRYSIFSEKVIEYFLKMGFKFGPKFNSYNIPLCINNRFLEKAFIRGIFNADGTVYRRYNKRYRNHPIFYGKYAIVQFKLKNSALIRSIRTMLQRSGFNVNRITRTREYYLIRITDQEHVERFFKEIATNHPYHLKRYENIMNN
jgi:hypothetical protein